MNTLPNEILLGIFEFLTANDLFSQVTFVNKNIAQLLREFYILQKVIQTVTGIKSFLVGDLEALHTVIRKSLKISSKKPVSLYGFGTTGGVDDSLSQYWVDNLFQLSSSSYCSNLRPGFTCAAVLKKTQKTSLTKTQEKYRKIAARIVRKNPILSQITNSKKNFKEPLLPLEEAIFLTAWYENPDFIISFDLDHSQETRRKAFEAVRDTQLHLSRFKQNNENFLFRELDHNSVSNFPLVACFKGLFISREGDYSCPGKSFFTFCSEEYVVVNKLNFSLFETAKSYEDLLVLVDQGVVEIDQFIKNDKFECAVFKRTSAMLRPMAWFRFSSDQCLKAEISFRKYFVGKYFYVSFIEVDNKMQEMNDQHNEPNVDFTYIVPYGFEFYTK